MFQQNHPKLQEIIGRVDAKLKRNLGITVACAESCTGGLLAACLTECSGSSQYFLGGVVAYHNDIKVSLLGLDHGLLNSDGAVSESSAIAMAKGLRKMTGASITISTTGIAGPTGGTPTKPVGTVWLGWDSAVNSGATLLQLNGSRQEVRQQTVESALLKIESLLKE